MQIDIALQLGGQFGTLGRRGRAVVVPLGDPRGVLAADIAFVEHHFAAGADIDIDAPALALGGLVILPRCEGLGRGHDHDIRPARFEIRHTPRRDFGILRDPERIGIRKIAVFTEQVCDDSAVIGR